MKDTLIIHCTYSEDEKDIAEILQESFRLFLQKELLSLAIQPQMEYCCSDEWSLSTRRKLCT